MAQPGDRPGLGPDALQQQRVRRQMRREHLDGDVAFQHLVLGTPHHGHAAGTKLVAEPEAAVQEIPGFHRQFDARSCRRKNPQPELQRFTRFS
jgi:hypothetical protein